MIDTALLARTVSEKKHLFFVQQHPELLRGSAADPRLAELTKSDAFTVLDGGTRAQYMTANRWVSLWSAMTRMGFLPYASLPRSRPTS